jgi:hypothetical protein
MFDELDFAVMDLYFLKPFLACSHVSDLLVSAAKSLFAILVKGVVLSSKTAYGKTGMASLLIS